jgi:hypothetical protein
VKADFGGGWSWTLAAEDDTRMTKKTGHRDASPSPPSGGSLSSSGDQDSMPTPTPDEAEALIRQVFGDVTVEEPW